MDKVQEIIKNILNKLNFLDFEQKISITNLTVAIFVLITAIRMTFGGSIIPLHFFDWKIQTIDIGATLPMLFALLNYSHKRNVINNLNKDSNDEKQS